MNQPALIALTLRLLAAIAILLPLSSCGDGRLAGTAESELPLLAIPGPATMSFCLLDRNAQGDFGGYTVVGARKADPGPQCRRDPRPPQ